MKKKEKIRDMFDDIAPSYDKLNHIMSLNIDRLWRKRALKVIVDGTQQEILDVACGTGDSTIAIAKAAAPGSRIMGVDISQNMMEPLMRKAAREGVHDRIRLKVADAEALPFQENSFHRVTCAFGVRNFEDKEQGLEEFHRVLKPGGKVVILELSVPTSRPVRRIYDLYFLHILPLVGGLVSGNKSAYKYLPASVHSFPAPESFCDILRDAGFKQVYYKTYTFGLCRLFVGVKA